MISDILKHATAHPAAVIVGLLTIIAAGTGAGTIYITNLTATIDNERAQHEQAIELLEREHSFVVSKLKNANKVCSGGLAMARERIKNAEKIWAEAAASVAEVKGQLTGGCSVQKLSPLVTKLEAVVQKERDIIASATVINSLVDASVVGLELTSSKGSIERRILRWPWILAAGSVVTATSVLALALMRRRLPPGKADR